VLNLDREGLISLSHPEARSFFETLASPRRQDQAWRDLKRNKNLLKYYKVTKASCGFSRKWRRSVGSRDHGASSSFLKAFG
jgi:hypothetical protein